MNRLLIQNGSILTMSTPEPDIFKGDVLVEGDSITQISNNITADEVDTVINAEGKVLMPGLINCHNHAAMVLLRVYCDDLRLMEWLSQKIWPAEDRLNGDDIYWGTMLAAAEMIKSGTTTFADMYFYMNEVAAAVQDSGMRAILCQGLLFNDDNGDKRIKAAQNLFDTWQGQAEGRITTMLGPHAPYTCPPDKLKLVMKLSRALDCGIHIHLAETSEEVDQMFNKYGKSPTKYLADLGLFDLHHVLLAHAVNLSRDDIFLLRDLKGGISHNPVSNQKLGCGIAPLKELRNLGITVGLGTDGAGSASTLDMFEEIKAAAWQQKNKFADPTVITAYDVLKMATIEGAKALGLDKEIGTLETGKKADIIIVDMQKPHLYPQNDICALLAYAANGADVDTSIVNGKILMKNRRLMSIAETEVLHQTQQIAQNL